MVVPTNGGILFLFWLDLKILDISRSLLVAAFLLGLCFSSQYILFYLKEAATKV